MHPHHPLDLALVLGPFLLLAPQVAHTAAGAPSPAPAHVSCSWRCSVRGGTRVPQACPPALRTELCASTLPVQRWPGPGGMHCPTQMVWPTHSQAPAPAGTVTQPPPSQWAAGRSLRSVGHACDPDRVLLCPAKSPAWRAPVLPKPSAQGPVSQGERLAAGLTPPPPPGEVGRPTQRHLELALPAQQPGHPLDSVTPGDAAQAWVRPCPQLPMAQSPRFPLRGPCLTPARSQESNQQEQWLPGQS